MDLPLHLPAGDGAPPPPRPEPKPRGGENEAEPERSAKATQPLPRPGRRPQRRPEKKLRKRRSRHDGRSHHWAFFVFPALVLGVILYFLWPDPPLPAFEPPSLDLGEQRTGQAGDSVAVTLTNRGERKLEILALDGAGVEFLVADEDCTGAILEPGGTCQLRVVFDPKEAGPRSETLSLVANAEASLVLAGVGIAPAIRFGSEVVDFGSRPVGGRSTGAAVAMVNAGSAPLRLGRVTIGGENEADYSLIGRCDKKVVQIGGGCDFRVAFAPRAAGVREAFLQVESDASAEPIRLPLRGSGAWEGPEIASEPARLSFPVQKPGSRSGEQKVRLTNRSEEGVTLSRIEVEDAEAGFRVVSESCRGRRLEPGDACEIRVLFAPRQAGAVATLLLARRDAGGGASVVLRGDSELPSLAFSPDAMSFERVRTGLRGPPVVVTLRSDGRVALVVQSLAVVGGGDAFAIQEDACSGRTLLPGKSCETTLTFSPRSEGDLRATLEVRSDAGGGRGEIPLVGRGIAPRLVVEPDRVDFASVVRTRSATRRLRLANRGEASLEIRGIEVQGAAAGDFEVEEIGCSLERGLAPGSECPLEIRFAPTRDGDRRATLEIRHGASQTGRVALAGKGLAPEPKLRLEPETVRFGEVYIGERSSVMTLTLYNDGEGSLSLRGFDLEGPDAGDFVIIPSTCSGIPRIAPHADCTLGLRFVPAEAGPRRATLRISHDDAEHEGRVELEGKALGGLGGT